MCWLQNIIIPCALFSNGLSLFSKLIRNFEFSLLSELKTAVPKQLYAAFQQQITTDINVTEFLSGWVTQPGYPVLNVNISNDRKTVELTQRKFLPHNSKHTDKTTWTIPITYASNKQSDFNKTITNQFLSNGLLRIELGEAVEWIVFNVQQTGEGSCERFNEIYVAFSFDWQNCLRFYVLYALLNSLLNLKLQSANKFSDDINVDLNEFVWKHRVKQE